MRFRFPLPTADRWHFVRRAALAPLALLLVAGLHAVRVATSNQTPWKGGGFGMFSTVDAESSRFVRAWANTEQGELPLAIPPALAKRVLELRAAPNRAAADDLARHLSLLEWRRPDLAQAAVGSQIAALPADQPISGSILRPAATSAGAPWPAVGLPRGLEAIAPREVAADALAIGGVRVEVWRMTFDRRSGRLERERMMVSERQPSERHETAKRNDQEPRTKDPTNLKSEFRNLKLPISREGFAR
ncbi:MAG: hypothetical protein SFU86_09030 [Pirellulaceae bacterium]|nr:hypothetical protein [Pirellulaceae bacterium]